jgi:hypothetical protein
MHKPTCTPVNKDTTFLSSSRKLLFYEIIAVRQGLSAFPAYLKIRNMIKIFALVHYIVNPRSMQGLDPLKTSIFGESILERINGCDSFAEYLH